MRSWLAVSAILPALGCSPFHPTDSGTNDAAVDASIDVPPPPPPDAQQCFGSILSICFNSGGDVPTTPTVLTGDISTDDPLVCNQHTRQSTAYCVVTGMGITIAAGTTIRAYGSRPLVLLSTTTVDLAGTLDASSTSIATAAHPTGPGVFPNPACAVGTVSADGNSGGFGGSFGGKGGNGYMLDSAVLPTAGLAIAFPPLRAGCPGGAGSTTTSNTTAGAGGNGGGAVAIIASSIALSGTINASGAGGLGGPAEKAGGGGGGSGGMIVLDASTITVSGATYALYANGGGGGQGGASSSGGLGVGPGQNGGESRGPGIPGGGGGSVLVVGGAGGNGAAGVTNNGVNAPASPMLPNGGGGGGGGGGGFIHAPGVTSNISPASTDP